MDKHTRENWQKIKKALESAGKTDSYFYTRACTILTRGYDPLERKLNS